MGPKQERNADSRDEPGGAERLARLTANGLVERYPSSDISGREAYRLTEKGRSLHGVMAQIKSWGLDHIEGTDARL